MKLRTLSTGAEDRPADRLIGEGRLLHQVEGDVVRRVHGRGDLLQDHVALAAKLGAVETRAKDDVAQDVERERHVLAQHAGVIGGGVDTGRGVEVAADILDLFGDLLGAAARRALEGHVFEEMGDAVLGSRLAPAAGPDPDAERDGLDLGHGVADHGQTIGEF